MAKPNYRRDFSIGETASITKTITDEMIRKTAEVTGDDNPLHLDDAYAAETRFGGRIAHGVICSGMISAVVGTKLPGHGGIYLQQTCKFLHPVFPGDAITATAKVTAWREEKRIVTLETVCKNQEGVEVVSGEAVLLVEETV
jgi:3-hydroxybutyryl-CoA dehydratase